MENFELLKDDDIKEEAATKNKLHNVPIKIKVKPSIKKGTGFSALPFTNCGKSAKKKRATFGFNMFVKKPWRNVFLNVPDCFSDDIIIFDFQWFPSICHIA